VRTEICDRLGIEFPIFAFTHCRDVVAAVSQAGGLGVLGALAFTPEQLATELKWIDEHVGDNPYGVDTVIPTKYEGMEEMDPEKLEEQIRAAIPREHSEFVSKLMTEHDVPELPEDSAVPGMLSWNITTGTRQVEIALQHEKVKLIANALGTPPKDVIGQIHDGGCLVAALAGSSKHALAHQDAGVDIVVAQGYEAGGHTGEIGSMVLWPEVIDAVAPTPVLAAGGIGTGRQMAAAMAMGAQGVWTGSLWLTVKEAESPLPQIESYLGATSRDTVRSRSFTGKPARMLRNDWTEAWDKPDTPSPLPLPLQGMLTMDVVVRSQRYPEMSQAIAFNPCGQIVGSLKQVRPARMVISQLIDEFLEAAEVLQSLIPQESD
jgi:NAD(P)H-dependent flavin oxidoreductase YrpB (nitropropane dioxygenase family)